MDSKDFQLLVGLYEDARQSHRSLGQRVSLSAPVVGDRLNSLESRGILQGYLLTMDPGSFDRDDLLVFFHQQEWTRQDAMKALKTPDVAWVSWKLEGGLTVGVWSRNRAQAVKTLTATLGTKPSGEAFTEGRKQEPLSIIDWLVVDALVDRPRLPLNKIVQSTGLSTKTVRKHLEKLLRTRTISIEPRLGALAEAGELVYQLAVFGRIRMSELRNVLGNAFLINETQEPPAKSLLCLSPNLGEVANKIRAVGKLSGVESAKITLNREMLVATEFVHSLVQKQIQNIQKRGRERAPPNVET